MGVLALSAVAWAEEPAPAVYPAAIFEFAERGESIKGYGAKVSDILFAQLATDEGLLLVERQELDKALKEQELTLSGAVSSADAVKVGQLTGAKLLVSGSIVEADGTLYLVAKLIGTETSRVIGRSVSGPASDAIGPLVEKLAAEVSGAVRSNAADLVAREIPMADRVAAIRQALGDSKRPTVFVRIPEHHVGQMTVDPAAETELVLLCKEAGFEVIDGSKGTEKQADVVIEGEGFSEFALRRGNLVSVKVRLEVKAIDRATGKVLANDRQTALEVDLTEQIAGKQALQKASAEIASRLLPKLVQKAP